MKQYLINEWRDLARLNRSDRPWQMPVAAALASGLPIFIGAAFGELRLGLAASLGGLVFLYLPATQLSHRMAWLMACAFGMTASHALGLLGHLAPALVVPLLVIITLLVMMVVRFYAMPPPGSVFFVMTAAIGAYNPVKGPDVLMQMGAIALGSVLAVGIAFLYSLYIVSRHGVPQPNPPQQPDFDVVVTEPVVIAFFVGLSLMAAHGLSLERPYWVPISCLAVIQGVSLRAAWTRQLQRILGTCLGLLLFLAIAHVQLGPWGVAAVLTLLAFVIESVIMRHYALASMFITPLAILLAEAGQGFVAAPQELMKARLLDTVVGALIGLAGAAFLHNARCRTAVSNSLRGLRF